MTHHAPPTIRRRRRRAAGGFSLLETLVAMLLLVVGLVGLLGMKLASTKHNANANARASASIHASDMFDRLRANPVRAVAGEYNLALGDPAPAVPGTIAEQDLAQWRLALSQHFAQGTGSVFVDADGEAAVVVGWIERDDAVPDGRTVAFLFRSRL